MSKPHVRVFVDDNPDPVMDKELPTELTLDTTQLEDGPHTLTVRAEDQSGNEGVETVPFSVRNGPGIRVSGLRPGTTRRGDINMKIDAFSADDPFDPQRAEARSSIPTWVWVLILCVIAWVIFYVATEWEVPTRYQNSPTYSSQGVQPGAPDTASPVKSGGAPGKP